jgi:hypothetical protein
MSSEGIPERSEDVDIGGDMSSGSSFGVDNMGDVPPGQPAPCTPEGHGRAQLSVASIMEHIQKNQSASLLESAGGVPLTEANLSTYQAVLAKLGSIALDPAAAAASPDDLAEGDRKKAAAMKSIIDGATWDARSYLANTFRNEHKAKTVEGERYKACKTRADAAEFRKEWCQSQYTNLVERKTFTQSWRRVDKTKGVYRPFGRLVQDFGGWGCQEAVDGACTAMSKCILMGAPWVHKHPQSGMTEYLVLEMGFEEEFESMWAKFSETWQGEGASSGSGRALGQAPSVVGGVAAAVAEGAGGSGGQAAEDEAKTGPPAVPKKGKGALAMPKGSGGGGGGLPSPGKIKKGADKEDSPSSDKKTEILKLTREAMKLKQTFHAASSNYVQVMHAISSDGKWSWAKGGPQEARLRDSKAKLQTELNSWHEEFLVTSEFTPMKKKYSTERIVVELTKFMQTKRLVETLAKVIASTNNAHIELMQT